MYFYTVINCLFNNICFISVYFIDELRLSFVEQNLLANLVFLVEQGTLVGSLLWLNEETVMFASDEIDHFEEKFWKKIFQNDFKNRRLRFEVDIKSELVMS